MATERCTLSCSMPEPVAGVAAATTATVTASSATSGSTPAVTARRPEPS